MAGCNLDNAKGMPMSGREYSNGENSSPDCNSANTEESNGWVLVDNRKFRERRSGNLESFCASDSDEDQIKVTRPFDPSGRSLTHVIEFGREALLRYDKLGSKCNIINVFISDFGKWKTHHFGILGDVAEALRKVLVKKSSLEISESSPADALFRVLTTKGNKKGNKSSSFNKYRALSGDPNSAIDTCTLE